MVRCATCFVDKLTSEFFDAAVPSCGHPSMHCLRCLSSKLAAPPPHNAAIPCAACGASGATCAFTAEAAAHIKAAFEKLAYEGAANAPDQPRPSVILAQDVTVTAMNGTRARVPYEPGLTIQALKAHLERAWGCPSLQQRLLKGSAVLYRYGHDDTLRTLADYRVVAGDQLQLLTIYNAAAGQNHIASAATDKHGNAAGAEYDLGLNGAFLGLSICVLHLYTGEGFDFVKPQQVLQEKGFTVTRWTKEAVPSPEQLRTALNTACQLWVIASSGPSLLTPEHVTIVTAFYRVGGGLYLWADNDPWYVETNLIAAQIFGDVKNQGNEPGQKMLSVRPKNAPAGTPGLVPGHLITTGIERLYEGATISTPSGAGITSLDPVCYSSTGNLLCACSERHGSRAVIDGGFTRLFCSWDTAGTARFVANAAAWLVSPVRLDREPKPRQTSGGEA